MVVKPHDVPERELRGAGFRFGEQIFGVQIGEPGNKKSKVIGYGSINFPPLEPAQVLVGKERSSVSVTIAEVPVGRECREPPAVRSDKIHGEGKVLANKRFVGVLFI